MDINKVVAERFPKYHLLPRLSPETREYPSLQAAQDDGWVYINADKSVHRHGGYILRCQDITEGRWINEKFALVVTHNDPDVVCPDTPLALSQELTYTNDQGEKRYTRRFRASDIRDAIAAFEHWVAENGITPTAIRQRHRSDSLNALAQSLGFDTWTKLETAAINGSVTITLA